MGIRDIDEGARGALADARAILQQVFDREVLVAPTDKIARGLILISKEIETRFRQYEVKHRLVTIVDPEARAQYLGEKL